MEYFAFLITIFNSAEPIITTGSMESVTWDDNWTTLTADGGLAAQFSHTVLITYNGVEVMTRCWQLLNSSFTIANGLCFFFKHSLAERCFSRKVLRMHAYVEEGMSWNCIDFCLTGNDIAEFQPSILKVVHLGSIMERPCLLIFPFWWFHLSDQWLWWWWWWCWWPKRIVVDWLVKIIQLGSGFLVYFWVQVQ